MLHATSHRLYTIHHRMCFFTVDRGLVVGHCFFLLEAMERFVVIRDGASTAAAAAAVTSSCGTAGAPAVVNREQNASERQPPPSPPPTPQAIVTPYRDVACISLTPHPPLGFVPLRGVVR